MVGTDLKDHSTIGKLYGSTVKFINNSSEIITINLYDNKRLFPDFDGGDYIAVNTPRGVGYMYCSSTLYKVNDVTTSTLAFTFKDRDGNFRYVYTRQPNVSESLVTTLTTAVTDYSAITQEDFPCGGAIYVVSCRGKNGNNGGTGGKGESYYAGSAGVGGVGGAGGNGWNVYFTPSSNWNIKGDKSENLYSTSFDLYTCQTYGGGGGGGGGAGAKGGGAGGAGGAGGSASPMPPGARVIFPSKTDVVITTTKRAGAFGSNGSNGQSSELSGNSGGKGGNVTGYAGTIYGSDGKLGNYQKGGNGGKGATYPYAYDINRISSTYDYTQVNGIISLTTPTSNAFANTVASTSGIVITKFTAYYNE